jgi:hypothetical protein
VKAFEEAWAGGYATSLGVAIASIVADEG